MFLYFNVVAPSEGSGMLCEEDSGDVTGGEVMIMLLVLEGEEERGEDAREVLSGDEPRGGDETERLRRGEPGERIGRGDDGRELRGDDGRADLGDKVVARGERDAWRGDPGGTTI